MNVTNEIEIELFSRPYTVQIPNVGQMVDIEIKKAVLSQNMYDRIHRMHTIPSSFALSIIEAVAYFSVLVPDLEKDLNGFKNLFELNPLQIKSLIRTYEKDFLPWYAQFIKLLNEDDTDNADVTGTETNG